VLFGLIVKELVVVIAIVAKVAVSKQIRLFRIGNVVKELCFVVENKKLFEINLIYIFIYI